MEVTSEPEGGVQSPVKPRGSSRCTGPEAGIGRVGGGTEGHWLRMAEPQGAQGQKAGQGHVFADFVDCGKELGLSSPL